jgi:alpha-L-rhamnosidase
MADRLLPAFTAKYFKPETGEYWNPGQKDFRQANNVVALAFGLVAEENQTQVVERLVRDLESRGDRLNTGAIGTKYLLPTLTRFGYGDLAYRIAAQTTYPSWGYWVSKGATSSWETWDNEGTEQTLDHPFLGTVDDWFFQGLLGIKPLTPGYASTVIAPLFPVDLDRASATIKTPHGTVGCEWVRTPDGITLDVTAPETVSVRLELAEQATELTSGFALDSSEGAGRVAWTGTGSFTVDLAQAI